LNDFNKAIEVIASTDIPSAVGGSALRFRQVIPFRLDIQVGPHGETLRGTFSLSGDYIALASIYVNIMRVSSPISTGLCQFYFRDETNAVIYVVNYQSGSVGDRHAVAQFMPIIFNTTPTTKTFRMFTSDGSVGGLVQYGAAGFFAQI
jgi:hypothetical protein